MGQDGRGRRGRAANPPPTLHVCVPEPRKLLAHPLASLTAPSQRAPPPAPVKSKSQPPPAPQPPLQLQPQALRAAPPAPVPLAPALDRSSSQRVSPSTGKVAASKSDPALSRSQTTRDRAPSAPSKAPLAVKPSPASSSSDLAAKQPAAQPPATSPVVARDKPERQQPAPSAAAASLAKHGPSGQATPRRREKKNTQNDSDIVKRLQAICTDADPTRLYRNLVKIGQGYV